MSEGRPLRSLTGWAGLLAGAFAWYGAHESSFYLLRVNCQHPWLVPAIHLAAIALALGGGYASWRFLRQQMSGAEAGEPGRFAACIGVGAALLFSLVILWQGVAGLVYQGCRA